jgi:RNA polymerase sigma factor (TIGR02999 family)
MAWDKVGGEERRRRGTTTTGRTRRCMSDITQLLRSASAGDHQAGDEVVRLLYADLRRLAGKRLRMSGDLTLDATALVHESYLRWQRAGKLDFPDRRHFLAYAAKVMHSIVIDQVRARRAERHGGGYREVTYNTSVADLPPQRDEEILRVHEALEELAAIDARLAQVVEMRYFAGLLESEIADSLGVTERTVQRDWQKARLFLSMAMK